MATPIKPHTDTGDIRPVDLSHPTPLSPPSEYIFQDLYTDRCTSHTYFPL